MRRLVQEGQLHPKKAKEGLALRIVADFHGEDAANEARREFDRIFQNKGEPDEVPQHRTPAGKGTVSLTGLIVEMGMARSKSEAARLIKQGAVRIDNERVAAGTLELDVQSGDERLIKVGKRRFARVVFE
jgi:tyrosyl-tRNA synthetase